MENLGTNEILVPLDYSENYNSEKQDEIQGAYFGCCFITCVIKGRTYSAIKVCF